MPPAQILHRHSTFGLAQEVDDLLLAERRAAREMGQRHISADPTPERYYSRVLPQDCPETKRNERRIAFLLAAC